MDKKLFLSRDPVIGFVYSGVAAYYTTGVIHIVQHSYQECVLDRDLNLQYTRSVCEMQSSVHYGDKTQRARSWSRG